MRRHQHKNDFFFSCILDPSAYGFGNALLISLLYMRRRVLGRDCFSCKLKLIFKRKVLHFAFFWKREFLELGDGLVLEHSEYRYTKLNKGFIKKMTTTKEGCHEISNFPRSCYMLRDNSKSTLQLQFHLWLLEYIQWQWLQTKQNVDNLCLSRITFLILELTYKAR